MAAPEHATFLLTHPAFLEHDPGAGHPECPGRLARTLELLEDAPVQGVVRKLPRRATRQELERVHGRGHVEGLEALSGRRAQLDPDTTSSPGSYEAAVLAAGAACDAVTCVMAAQAVNAFALVRPPGHHAEADRAMGFCLFNNVAIAAEAARQAGADRVLILDWDVHHGNGTQHLFAGRADVLYQSVHQFPFYPGTGAAEEIGTGAGEGFTVNCPLPPGQTDADYGVVFEELFLPVARAYRPSLILVSAGFDPHEDDPLGQMRVTERGFAAMAASVRALADEICGGRLVLVLEGGYSLPGLSRSVHACLEVLRGRDEAFPRGAGAAAPASVARTRQRLRGRWFAR